MAADPVPPTADHFAALYRHEGRRAFATLLRLLRDFDRAEEALHDAFRAALESWPVDGVPGNPVAWLVTAGHRRAIDRLRQQQRLTPLELEPPASGSNEPTEPDEVADDQLRLIFTCCHPGLAEEARAALTLREVCGLTTEQIARAFLVPVPTLAQRIVRAKTKIRAAGIPFEVPAGAELAARLPSVLRVVYLLFNEGYRRSGGVELIGVELAAEAIRLARTLVAQLPEPECLGLLGLMLLHQSRAAARVDGLGDLVLLEQQDRTRWDRAAIAEGLVLVEQALRSGRAGAYAVQAAIAAVHAEAATAAATDWRQIAALYDVLLRIEPQPVVALNRAVAQAMAGDLLGGLQQVEALAAAALADYHPAHAALGDLLRRLGRTDQARTAFAAALARCEQETERRHLRQTLEALGAGDAGGSGGPPGQHP
ncbi:MAG: RNA polymerase subunit sigma-24 [Planctomycetes bacterium]|jgi:RNA polymerase sigma-70 factor (ECF subfamily)|nr:RNA polymerase subunit sigma-24 [Planctomycetota bacterium]